ncbi:hypothetical protein BO85DRAFT_448789 [Aspergillus piperis CBS 112811]|uniref:Uncharacterized protein n=1 Tax=Aspergillus piperis CBS 112811 TaxID=1448313 RepID=A0A8G1VMF4_9EURO|nr:hypothetical protein BO85DRAFT_448789 [Aspergillus piperis CBS 112811]RAH58789.1 hypothetical protein BO85DRAFT_448789 [Aspergillus piperis CBS 112811]
MIESTTFVKSHVLHHLHARISLQEQGYLLHETTEYDHHQIVTITPPFTSRCKQNQERDL